MSAFGRLTGRRTLGRILGWGCAAALSLGGCAPEATRDEPSAAVGVFYGGQIQRRELVEVSRLKPPKIGFRVTLPGGGSETPRPQLIRYQIVRPGPAGRRVTKEGELQVAPDLTHIDHLVPLSQSSKMGVWNVRVATSQTLLADRALYLRAAP